MRRYEDYLREKIEQNPGFADLMAETRAEGDLALALYYAREAAGLSQRELAEKAGISPRALRSIEKAGRTPKLATLWRLADALGVEIRLLPGRGSAVLAVSQPQSAPVENAPSGPSRATA